MSCEGCKEHDDTIIKEAQNLANSSGQWVGIYTDGRGEKQYAIAGTGDYPIQHWISPNEIRQVSSDTVK